MTTATGTTRTDQIDGNLPYASWNALAGDGDELAYGDDAEGLFAGVDAGGSGNDMLDLSDADVESIEYTSPDDQDGVVHFGDGTSMSFTEVRVIIAGPNCFTPGTLIATPRGEVAVEDLRVGDRIITRDNGIQEIRWTGRTDMTGLELQARPHLKPVLIRAGSLGNGLPERDMMVSPNHRLLVASDRTQLYFEESEVLAAAKHLVGLPGIQIVDVMRTAYIHFMFDRHEVVLSNGAWTESFQPGDFSMKGIGNAQRNEIVELFPQLANKGGREGYASARKSLKKHEVHLLVR